MNTNLCNPVQALATLRRRAELFHRIRSFFEARAVLEVDTPILSRSGTPNAISIASKPLWPLAFHVSGVPMKRLLAFGSGPFSARRVFRADECGQRTTRFVMPNGIGRACAGRADR